MNCLYLEETPTGVTEERSKNLNGNTISNVLVIKSEIKTELNLCLHETKKFHPHDSNLRPSMQSRSRN